MKKKEFILILLIGIISFFTHIVFWTHPQEFVFDEVFFARFAQDYTQGTYFFDQHPPLGKLLLGGMSKIIGVEPYKAQFVIGERFGEPDVAVLRLLPIWAGILLPLVIYGICRQLKFSLMVSFFAAMLVVFENSIIVQSRFVLIDAFLLLFGFASLYFYLLSRSKHSLKLFAASIILATGALSIKWTGATFLFLILVLEVYKALPVWRQGRFWIKRALFVVVIPAIVYVGLFAIHFALLPNPGSGDPFMTQDFRNKSFIGKFTELNHEMLAANQRLTEEHSYGSEWYTWPIMSRPIYYWYKDLQTKESRIYLLGNPLVYWLGSLGVVMLSLFCLFWYKKFNHHKAAYILLLGYLINFLPFAMIGRVMFLYHYQISLIFSVLCCAYLFNLWNWKYRRYVLAGILFAVYACFLFFAPLTYGLPLTKPEYEQRLWFQSWL